MSSLIGKPTCELDEMPREIKELPSTGIVFSILIQTDSEIRIPNVVYQNRAHDHIFDCHLPINEAVYVEKINGDEQLIYRTAEMKLNKLYPIKWKEENYALKKTEHNVEIFKFYPDKK